MNKQERRVISRRISKLEADITGYQILIRQAEEAIEKLQKKLAY